MHLHSPLRTVPSDEGTRDAKLTRGVIGTGVQDGSAVSRQGKRQGRRSRTRNRTRLDPAYVRYPSHRRHLARLHLKNTPGCAVIGLDLHRDHRFDQDGHIRTPRLRSRVSYCGCLQIAALSETTGKHLRNRKPCSPGAVLCPPCCVVRVDTVSDRRAREYEIWQARQVLSTVAEKRVLHPSGNWRRPASAIIKRDEAGLKRVVSDVSSAGSPTWQILNTPRPGKSCIP